MYAEKCKRDTPYPAKCAVKKPLKATPADNCTASFDDIKIHYTAASSAHNSSCFSDMQGAVQMKLKISNLTEDPDDELSVDDVDDIVEAVYYGPLEDAASKDEVKTKIKELIEDAELHSFEHDYDLNDALYDFFMKAHDEESHEEEISDESEEEGPAIYTGVLSEHPDYHRKIKPQILASIPVKYLQRLMRSKGQTNFDFHMCRGRLYVSGNHSKAAEKDTGYDITVYQDGTCKIIKSEDESEE